MKRYDILQTIPPGCSELPTIEYVEIPEGDWVRADDVAARIAELEAALRELVQRCDGEQGVRKDGSNIDTLAAHVALGDLNA